MTTRILGPCAVSTEKKNNSRKNVILKVGKGRTVTKCMLFNVITVREKGNDRNRGEKRAVL